MQRRRGDDRGIVKAAEIKKIVQAVKDQDKYVHEVILRSSRHPTQGQISVRLAPQGSCCTSSARRMLLDIAPFRRLRKNRVHRSAYSATGLA